MTDDGDGANLAAVLVTANFPSFVADRYAILKGYILRPLHDRLLYRPGPIYLIERRDHVTRHEQNLSSFAGVCVHPRAIMSRRNNGIMMCNNAIR